jgi:hypothetical protein
MLRLRAPYCQPRIGSKVRRRAASRWWLIRWRRHVLGTAEVSVGRVRDLAIWGYPETYRCSADARASCSRAPRRMPGSPQQSKALGLWDAVRAVVLTCMAGGQGRHKAVMDEEDGVLKQRYRCPHAAHPTNPQRSTLSRYGIRGAAAPTSYGTTHNSQTSSLYGNIWVKWTKSRRAMSAPWGCA